MCTGNRHNDTSAVLRQDKASRTLFYTVMPLIKYPVLSFLSLSLWAAGNKQGDTEGCGRTGHCARVAGGTRPENTQMIRQTLKNQHFNPSCLQSISPQANNVLTLYHISRVKVRNVLTTPLHHCAFLYFVLELSQCVFYPLTWTEIFWCDIYNLYDINI